MPPSPQPESPEPDVPPRRASSLPPETTRKKRSPTLTSAFKKMRIEAGDSNINEGTVEIEELSPEAIIPDSINIMRDPEVVLQEDEAEADGSLDDKFTDIDLEGDGSGRQVTSDEEAVFVPLQQMTNKRKHNPADDEESYERQRKRTVSPGSFSPNRGNR